MGTGETITYAISSSRFAANAAVRLLAGESGATATTTGCGGCAGTGVTDAAAAEPVAISDSGRCDALVVTTVSPSSESVASAAAGGSPLLHEIEQ